MVALKKKKGRHARHALLPCSCVLSTTTRPQQARIASGALFRGFGLLDYRRSLCRMQRIVSTCSLLARATMVPYLN